MMIEEIKNRIKDSRVPRNVDYPSFAVYMETQFFTSLPHVFYMIFPLIVLGAIVAFTFADFSMLICLYFIVLFISFIFSAFMENVVVSIFSGVLFGIVSGIWCYVIDYGYVHLHFLQVIEICILMGVLFSVLGFFIWPIFIEGISD